jgi:Trp operon repressor
VKKPWNTEDELRLVELVNQNLSRPEIAKTLGRTVASIERRLNIVRTRAPQAD